MMFVPLAAGIKKCLDEEINYENALGKVKTIADESQKSIGKIGEEMKTVSKTYGQDITSVADTFYSVISATVDTANAIDYVHVASQMAVGGFADMDTAVGGLTASMAAYKKHGYDMYRIGDILAQTQVKGKTTINELSESLGEVLPYASNVGMSFEDLGTSMAVLTSNGLSTSMATVTLKNAINSILNPSANAKKAFDKLGVAYGSNAFKGGAFGDYLDQLKEAVGLSDTAKEKLTELMKKEDVTDEELTDFYVNAGINIDNLLTMFKNIRGATAMLSLTGSVEKYKTFRESMNEENSKGLLQKQADIMMETPKMQMQILTQNLNDNLRRFGEKLMPKFNQFLGYANDMLEKLNGMSDEQISKIVDNVVKIATASAGLIVLGTIAKSLASIFTLLNVIWKPLSKIIFAKAATTAATGAASAAGGAAAATGGGILAGIGGVISKVIPAVGGFILGMKASELEIADDSFTGKYGDQAIYYEYLEEQGNAKEALVGDTNIDDSITNNETVNNYAKNYDTYNPITNSWDYANKSTNNETANTFAKNYDTYNPITNSWDYANKSTNITNDNTKNYDTYDPINNIWDYADKSSNIINNDNKIKNTTNNTNITNNEIKEDKGKVAYQVYDPKENKFTNVYISNVDVSGVEDLSSIIDELNQAADAMR